MNNERKTWLERACEAAVSITDEVGFAKIARKF